MAAPTVADLLVDVGGVGIRPDDPFVFASGLRSPIYCNNRLFLSRPSERKAMLAQLYALIEGTAGGNWDAVAGVATSGIPFAAWVAAQFDKPMVYVRSAEKDHGKRHRIEGGLPPGSRVILLEDLITTGGSALSAIEALREAGLVCDACFSLFDYGFRSAAEAFKSQSVHRETLTGIEHLLSALHTRNLASDEDVAQVRRWHDQVNGDAAAKRA